MVQGRRRRSHWGIDCRFRCIPKGYYVQHFSGRGGVGILNRKGKRGNYSAAHLAPQIVIQWGVIRLEFIQGLLDGGRPNGDSIRGRH